LRRLARLALAVALAGCAPVASLPDAPVPYGSAIVVDAEPVPLDAANPSRTHVGDLAYAGGLILTSKQTSRLHGLSDLKVSPDGRIIAIGDQSDFFEGRIVLDAKGRLTGLRDGKLSALKDVTGADLFAGGQEEYDSEGLAELAAGMVVTFEQHDRVLLFPRGGGLPKPAPAPSGAIKHNKGMEAAVAAPEVGPDAYRVGIEGTGELFVCRLSGPCVADGAIDLKGSELVAIDNLPGGGRVYMFRSFSALRGNVIRLLLTDAQGRTLTEAEIARPLTVDNLEGVAAVPRGGGVRLYLVSDDNFGMYEGKPTGQKTLLLAFDWKPK
jgi:hypothetical protein